MVRGRKPATRRSIPKSLKPAYDLAVDQGWAVYVTGGGHLQWRPPQGDFVITGHTPSETRALDKELSDLRRGGLKGLRSRR